MIVGQSLMSHVLTSLVTFMLRVPPLPWHCRYPAPELMLPRAGQTGQAITIDGTGNRDRP